MKVICVCHLQSSIYSLALKSVISFSTLILIGLIIAYHWCEVQVTCPLHLEICLCNQSAAFIVRDA